MTAAKRSELAAGAGALRRRATGCRGLSGWRCCWLWASTCTFGVSPKLAGMPTIVDCASGSASVSIHIPANTTSKAHSYSFQVTAKGSGKSRAGGGNGHGRARGRAVCDVLRSESGRSAFEWRVGQSGRDGHQRVQLQLQRLPKLSGFPVTVPCTSGSATKTAGLPGEHDPEDKEVQLQPHRVRCWISAGRDRSQSPWRPRTRSIRPHPTRSPLTGARRTAPASTSPGRTPAILISRL